MMTACAAAYRATPVLKSAVGGWSKLQTTGIFRLHKPLNSLLLIACFTQYGSQPDNLVIPCKVKSSLFISVEIDREYCLL